MKFDRTLPQWASPALLASIILVAIQVSIGLLFKSVQVKGGYSFSTSASIAISEFFKLVLSSIFFHRSLNRSKAPRDSQYSPLRSDEAIPFNDLSAAEPRVSSDSIKLSTPALSEEITPTWKNLTLSCLQFIRDFVDPLSTPTVVGYGQLALLYALINNTVFVLFRLADPGTINLVKSGITLATALTSMIFLGSNIAKMQWAAIGFQICGVMLSQYHPGSGAVYPLPTYAVLLGQTFIAAVAGVFNQHLLKSQNATLHAQNMVLYMFGVILNVTIHWTTKMLKPTEPDFFEGFGNIGAILVIVSSVLNGLAITAIYKYADAIAKCFATAVSTAILLCLAPLLFHTSFSFLVLPGTLIVFIATWMYVESAPPEKGPGLTEQLAAMPTHEPKSSRAERMISAFTPWGSLAWYGLAATAVAAISAIVALNTWDIRSMQKPEAPKHSTSNRSPFANTVGFLRMNHHVERMPLLSKYEPFFHTLHYSAQPGANHAWPTKNTTNITHSTWGDHMSVYMPVADVMRLILADEKYNSIDGLLNFQLDVWVNPMEFGNMDFTRAWLVNGRDNPTKVHLTDDTKWAWWVKYDLWNQGVKSLNSLNGTKYAVDQIRITNGFADLYYIPRRYFKDFIYLVERWFPQFHETTIPTILDVLDRAYREEAGTHQVLWLADCWGNTMAKDPPAEALLYERCGHRIALNKKKQTKIHFGRLDRQAALLTAHKNASATV